VRCDGAERVGGLVKTENELRFDAARKALTATQDHETNAGYDEAYAEYTAAKAELTETELKSYWDSQVESEFDKCTHRVSMSLPDHDGNVFALVASEDIAKELNYRVQMQAYPYLGVNLVMQQFGLTEAPRVELGSIEYDGALAVAQRDAAEASAQVQEMRKELWALRDYVGVPRGTTVQEFIDNGPKMAMELRSQLESAFQSLLSQIDHHVPHVPKQFPGSKP
jgi:hypothetical protein